MSGPDQSIPNTVKEFIFIEISHCRPTNLYKMFPLAGILQTFSKTLSNFFCFARDWKDSFFQNTSQWLLAVITFDVD